MTNLLVLAVVAFAFVALPSLALTQPPVDLRDKEGVVDPKDLKKHDPPERPLRTKEPPSPPTQTRSDSVDSSSGTVKTPPSDQGQDPGPGGLPVPGVDPRRLRPIPVPGR